MSPDPPPINPAPAPHQRRRANVALACWLAGLAALLALGVLVVVHPDKDRETAPRVVCGSNLRQIGQAIQLQPATSGNP